MYSVRNLRDDDVTACYEIAAENAKIYDEYLEKNVLPEDFLPDTRFDALVRENTTRFIVVKKAVNLSDDNKVFCEQVVGFAGFDTKDHNFNKILIIESIEEDSEIIYKLLIDEIVGRAWRAKKKISFEVPETKLYLYALAVKLGFSKKHWVHSTNSGTPDIIVLELAA